MNRFGFQRHWHFRNPWVVLAIALSVAIVFTVLAAPSTTDQRRGSTFSRGPDGYGAWYAFMEQQGHPVRRWQRPFQDFAAGVKQPDSSTAPATFLRVNGSWTAGLLTSAEREWVKQGNRLVLIGVQTPAVAPHFQTWQKSAAGLVKIETRRRHQPLGNEHQQLLGDRFGATVWQQDFGKGEVVFINTPHFAANAYQDEPGNYPFLARLVTQDGHTVWVDEYIHGYIASDLIHQTVAKDWVGYLMNTPLFTGLVQLGFLLLIVLWAENQRFGPPVTPSTTIEDNSTAYIQALAGILQRAGSSEFILDLVGRVEQLNIQKALGLGSALLEPEVLLAAWVQKTGRPATELASVLQPYWRQQRLRPADLLSWLDQIQTVRHHLRP